MQKFQMKMLFPVEMFSGSPLIIADSEERARIYSTIAESRQTEIGWETDLDCYEVTVRIHKDASAEVIYWLISHIDLVKSCCDWQKALERDLPKELIEHNKKYLDEMTY